MKPVIVQSGSQKYPLVRPFSGDGGFGGGFGSPLLPRLADDPCVCCPQGPGGPSSPYPSCAACFADIKGILFTASGYQTRICSNSGPTFAVTYRCLGDNLNAAWALTELVSNFGGVKTFALTLSADPNSCEGVLVGDSSATGFPGSPCTMRTYLKWITCSVRCTGSALTFSPVSAGYFGCQSSAQCPVGDSAQFTVGADASTPFADACDRWIAAQDNVTYNHCNRGIGNCSFPLGNASHAFQPIW